MRAREKEPSGSRMDTTSGFWGNELADQLAKNSILASTEQGRLRPFQGPEPALPISINYIKQAIKTWQRHRHTKRWITATKMNKHTRSYVPRPLYDKQSISRETKKNAQVLTYLYTGHGPWGRHLCKINKAQSPLCHKCENETDCPAHFVESCEATCVERYIVWSCAIGSGNILRYSSKQELLEFCRYTRRFK